MFNSNKYLLTFLLVLLSTYLLIQWIGYWRRQQPVAVMVFVQTIHHFAGRVKNILYRPWFSLKKIRS